MKLSLEDMQRKGNATCYYCGEELTENNLSAWEEFAYEDDEQITVQQCLLCQEASNRSLSSCIKVDDAFVPQRTFEECRKEVIEQNVSLSALKQFELIDRRMEN